MMHHIHESHEIGISLSFSPPSLSLSRLPSLACFPSLSSSPWLDRRQQDFLFGGKRAQLIKGHVPSRPIYKITIYNNYIYIYIYIYTYIYK